jgi:hypothetical protein
MTSAATAVLEHNENNSFLQQVTQIIESWNTDVKHETKQISQETIVNMFTQHNISKLQALEEFPKKEFNKLFKTKANIKTATAQGFRKFLTLKLKEQQPTNSEEEEEEEEEEQQQIQKAVTVPELNTINNVTEQEQEQKQENGDKSHTTQVYILCIALFCFVHFIFNSFLLYVCMCVLCCVITKKSINKL